MPPVTIKIFLTKGNPEGQRIAEISNWIGEAIASPRTELKELLSRGEIDSPEYTYLWETTRNPASPQYKLVKLSPYPEE